MRQKLSSLGPLFASAPSAAHTPRHNGFFASARWLELLLTAAVAMVLAMLAAPLATPGTDHGLQQRYGSPGLLDGAVPAAAYPSGWQALIQQPGTAVPQDVRAIGMLRGAGFWLALLGGTGWLALQLARHGALWSLALATALWMALALLLRPFQWSGMFCLGAVAAALGATLLGLMFRAGRVPHRSAGAAALNPWTACVWPGWLLLAGAGCLVVLDFAARGPVLAGEASSMLKPGARYFGLNQVDGLWLASGLLILCAACCRSIVLAWIRSCTLLALLWQRPRGPLVLLLLALCLALALGWLGASAHLAYLRLPSVRGAGQPHISGELLRLAACAAMAWFAYRFGEWRGSAGRAWGGLRQLFLLLALCTLGLVLSDDKGPLLVLALAVAVLVGVPVLQQAAGRARAGAAQQAARGAGLLLAAGIAVAALGLWRTALTDWLPRLSHDAAVRELLRESPFEARSPNLAQVRWLMDATPTAGFGLARVPYCGARALAGQGACTLGSGAPLQMPSDFAFVPLFATWGAAGATLLVFAALVWLFVLPAGMLVDWRARSVQQPLNRIGLLPVWLVAVIALVAQAQTVVSVGASLGWSSLTGVTLPVMGYGVAALCTLAAGVGLAANPAFGESSNANTEAAC